MSFVDVFKNLKTFITSSLKYSSVGFIVLIPLAVALSYFGFIKEDTTVLITEIVLFFGLADSILNAVLNKIKKEKVEFAEIKNDIEAKNFEALAKYKEQGQFSQQAIDQISNLITGILAKKQVDSETYAEAQKVVEELNKTVASDNSVASEPNQLNEKVEFTR